jgi:hypothetical protein
MNKTIATALIGAVTGAGMLAPSAAHALYTDSCTGVGAGGVTIGIVSGPSNGVGTGVCVGLPFTLPGGSPNPVEGGALEAGVGSGGSRLCTPVAPIQVPGPGVYVIAQGNTFNNATPYSSGYYGLSDNETGGEESCPPLGATGTPDNGSGTNSGGYVGLPFGVYAPVPLVVCGTNGGTFSNAGRDGCTLP